MRSENLDTRMLFLQSCNWEKLEKASMYNNWKLAKEVKVGHSHTGGLLPAIGTGEVRGLQGILGEQWFQVAR